MCLLMAQKSQLEEEVQNRKDEEGNRNKGKNQARGSTKVELYRARLESQKNPDAPNNYHDSRLPPTYRLLSGRNTFIMRQVHNIRILQNSKHTQTSR